MTARSLLRPISVLAAALCAALALAAPAAAQTAGERSRYVGGEGESHLVLTYKATPEKRAAFRRYMEGPGVAQFERWKKAGVLQDFRLLFATQVNEQLPDMWAILDFARFSDIGRWHAVERQYPGGLAPEGLALGVPKTDVYTDVPWRGGAPKADQSKSMYMIIPYTTLVGPDEYHAFVDAYVIPQVKGWVKSGLMSSYAIHTDQNPTHAPWDSLLVFEYDGLRGIALRDTLKQSIRDQLKDDPGYKKYSAIKTTIRDEGQPATYEAILPR